MRIGRTQSTMFETRDASTDPLMNLSQAQLSFLQTESAPLNPVQRRILAERGRHEGAVRGDDVVFSLEGNRAGPIALSSDQEKAAKAKGATRMSQILDFAFYGDFLPVDLEQRFAKMFE